MEYPYRVVVCCPAGRARYLKVLMPYILREKEVIDEFHWWVNTDNREDLDYMRQWVNQDPSFFKWVELDQDIEIGLRRIDHFYKGCVDPQTLYIKIDDDVVWMQPDALKKLIEFRLQHPQYFLVFPNIINNVICTHLHQSIGALPYLWGSFTHNPFCELSWVDGPIAQKIHEHFFYQQEQHALEAYRLPTWILADYIRTSINCIAWMGRDFGCFKGIIPHPHNDEHALSSVIPRALMRPCAIDGKTLICHYAYGPQRVYLDQTEVLASYQHLAKPLEKQLSSMYTF